VHDFAVFCICGRRGISVYLDEEDCQDLAKALAKIDCEMSSDAEWDECAFSAGRQ